MPLLWLPRPSEGADQEVRRGAGALRRSQVFSHFSPRGDARGPVSRRVGAFGGLPRPPACSPPEGGLTRQAPSLQASLSHGKPARSANTALVESADPRPRLEGVAPHPPARSAAGGWVLLVSPRAGRARALRPAHHVRGGGRGLDVRRAPLLLLALCAPQDAGDALRRAPAHFDPSHQWIDDGRSDTSVCGVLLETFSASSWTSSVRSFLAKF